MMRVKTARQRRREEEWLEPRSRASGIDETLEQMDGPLEFLLFAGAEARFDHPAEPVIAGSASFRGPPSAGFRQ